MTPEMRAECERLFREAEALDLRWVEQGIAERPDVVGYAGITDEWTVTVFRFRPVKVRPEVSGDLELEAPEGVFAYDGGLKKGTMVVHMTPEVAERIWRKAHSQKEAK